MQANRINILDLRSQLPTKIDLFLCCASFEKRSTVLSAALNRDVVSKCIVFYYREFSLSAAPSLDYLKKCWGRKYQERQLFFQNPLATADSLISALDDAIQIRESPIVVIDVTTFTREALLILINALHTRRKKLSSVTAIYNVAGEMAIDWLSKGVIEVRSVLGFSGLPVPSRKLHLVILIGFETERARIIIEEYEPDLISIGSGGPEASISRAFHERNTRFVAELASVCGNAVEQFTVSLVDPFQTKKDIEGHVSRFPDFNVVLAPINNKISTIGAALYGLSEPNCQLCYSAPELYNESGYSAPSEEAIVAELDWQEF